MSDLRTRAAARRATALEIVRDLELARRWSAVGDHRLVGSVALDLVVEPDIDMETYTAAPTVEAGWSVLSSLAVLPGVRRAKFTNALDQPDQGLYFQLQYELADVLWKIDMWLLPTDHPGPRGCDLVNPMLQALTPTTRDRILAIKEAAYAEAVPLQGIRVYQAVLDAGVATYPEFRTWSADIPDALTPWRPSEHRDRT
ncbi:hypothetical protein [Actinomadura rupiterrae]|uniref:hypothetical protein n=1 Tax=Actinomadura rupiterrae TaxID=559627 RepID=UPI0020A3FE19|nr:hypothetical protein [Actinomadura rupiterrae]MCP2341968.1 hypothetical protein [Actinomadura rupiterrae]